MAENRLDREQQTREATSRKKRWQRPSALPSPNPRKGWAHRWIRVAMHGSVDPSNVSSKLREGWEPCRKEDYPEMHVVYEESKEFKDNIVIGGEMLCRAPDYLVDERNQFFKDQTKAQMTSVNEKLLRESDPRMPVFTNSKTEVTRFGRGSRK